MKSSTLTFGFLLGLVAASLLFAFLKPSDEGGGSQVRRIQVAHTLPTTHPVHAGIEYFAERVAVHSRGAFKVDVFPNGQLGSETQTLEQIQSGTLDMAKVGAATMGSFVPVTKVFSLPYLFRDEDHYWQVLESAIGQSILEGLAVNTSGKPSGFRGLTYYDAGSRNFYAQKPILRPADLKGLKIRVMSDPVAIDMVAAIGGAPTPISWGELYTALQQGVVDGAENNPPSFVSSRHFEVCKEFSFDHHTRVPDILIIASQLWQALGPEERKWLQDAAAESTVFQRKAWAEGVEEALAVMEAEGVTIHYPELEPFRRATESVRAKYAEGPLRDLTEAILNTTGE